MKLNKDLKVAIVCDWLTGIGGAELVVLELHKMFPKAPIYTSQYDPTKIDWFKDADVRTTWINKLPKRLKKFLPVLRAVSFSRLDLSNYDLVISASGAEAKGISTGANTIHVSYCHSPTHYYWTRFEVYLENPGFGMFDWLARFGLKILIGPMRKWDFRAAQKPNYLIANSTYTQKNIKKYYKRDSVIIFPPVNIEQYKPSKDSTRNGYIVVGRQTPYKRIDLAVSACTKLGLDLVVVGNGPENKKLHSLAGPTITFLGQISDKEKNKYLHSAKAFIFPGIDDFGIAAVEALAAGTPVIAYSVGGVLDYIDKSNGLLFNTQSVGVLCKSIEESKKITFNDQTVHYSSRKFSEENFSQNLISLLTSL